MYNFPSIHKSCEDEKSAWIFQLHSLRTGIEFFLTITITYMSFFQKEWKNISDINIFLFVVAAVFLNVETFNLTLGTWYIWKCGQTRLPRRTKWDKLAYQINKLGILCWLEKYWAAALLDIFFLGDQAYTLFSPLLSMLMWVFSIKDLRNGQPLSDL